MAGNDIAYRRLAAAVVLQAVQVHTGAKPPDEYGQGTREEAGAFLESEGLAFWCDVLDIDAERLRRGLAGVEQLETTL